MQDYLLLLAQAADAPAGGDAAPAAPAAAPGESTTQQPDPATEGEPGQETKGPGSMLIPMVLMFLVLYFFLFRGPKKKQQQQKQMLDAMKKNDRVRTIGGIIGTIVDIRDDEVVIKIDESNNTKMRLARGAISKITTDEPSGATETK